MKKSLSLKFPDVEKLKLKMESELNKDLEDLKK